MDTNNNTTSSSHLSAEKQEASEADDKESADSSHASKVRPSAESKLAEANVLSMPSILVDNKHLSHHHHQLAATSQIGGKGTVRRRRLRHSIRASSTDSEQLRQFQARHHLSDIGHMERVTFIQDNGKITSYEKVPVHSNAKDHIFYFDLSKYSNNKLHRTRSKTDVMNASSSSIDEISKLSPATGVKLERGDQLLASLNFLDQQERFNSEFDCLDRDRFYAIRSRISELVGSPDPISYLSSLKSFPTEYQAKTSSPQYLSASNLIDQADKDFIPTLPDGCTFEKHPEHTNTATSNSNSNQISNETADNGSKKVKQAQSVLISVEQPVGLSRTQKRKEKKRKAKKQNEEKKSENGHLESKAQNLKELAAEQHQQVKSPKILKLKNESKSNKKQKSTVSEQTSSSSSQSLSSSKSSSTLALTIQTSPNSDSNANQQQAVTAKQKKAKQNNTKEETDLRDLAFLRIKPVKKSKKNSKKKGDKNKLSKKNMSTKQSDNNDSDKTSDNSLSCSTLNAESTSDLTEKTSTPTETSNESDSKSSLKSKKSLKKSSSKKNDSKDINETLETKESKSSKETNKSKESSVTKSSKEFKETKELKKLKVTETKETKEVSETKETKVTKKKKGVNESTEKRETKEVKEFTESTGGDDNQKKQVKESKESKETKKSKESKGAKHLNESKELRESKESLESKQEPDGILNTKEVKEVKESKETKDTKTPKHSLFAKVLETRESRECTKSTDTKENDEFKETKESNVSKESKDSKESVEAVNGHEKDRSDSAPSSPSPNESSWNSFTPLSSSPKVFIHEDRQFYESNRTENDLADSEDLEKKVYEAHLTHEGHYYATDSIKREETKKCPPKTSAVNVEYVNDSLDIVNDNSGSSRVDVPISYDEQNKNLSSDTHSTATTMNDANDIQTDTQIDAPDKGTPGDETLDGVLPIDGDNTSEDVTEMSEESNLNTSTASEIVKIVISNSLKEEIANADEQDKDLISTILTKQEADPSETSAVTEKVPHPQELTPEASIDQVIASDRLRTDDLNNETENNALNDIEQCQMDVSITNDETIRSAGDSAAKKIENERDFFEPSSKEHDLTKIDSNNLTDITLPEKNDEQLNEDKIADSNVNPVNMSNARNDTERTTIKENTNESQQSPNTSSNSEDDSMHTAVQTALSPSTSELSMIRPATSYDSNIYTTAESSPITLQKEGSDLSNEKVQIPVAKPLDVVDQILDHFEYRDIPDPNSSVSNCDVSTDNVDEQLRKIEDMTKESLNKYFDKNVLRFVDDFNNNKFEFEPPLHSSSDDNLSKSTLQDEEKVQTPSATEKLLEASINDAKVTLLYSESDLKKKDNLNQDSLLNKSFIINEDTEEDASEEILKSSFQVIEDLSKCIKTMIEEDQENVYNNKNPSSDDESFEFVKDEEFEPKIEINKNLGELLKENGENRGESKEIVNESKSFDKNNLYINFETNVCEELMKNLNDMNSMIENETKTPDQLNKIILSQVEKPSEQNAKKEGELLSELDKLVNIFVENKNELKIKTMETRDNVNLNNIIADSIITDQTEIENDKKTKSKEEDFEQIVNYFINRDDDKEATEEVEPSVPESVEDSKPSEDIEEPSTLNSEAKDKFNSIIDEFINKDEEVVESPIVEEQTIDETPVDQETKVEAEPVQSEEVHVDTIEATEVKTEEVTVGEILSEVEPSVPESVEDSKPSEDIQIDTYLIIENNSKLEQIDHTPSEHEVLIEDYDVNVEEIVDTHIPIKVDTNPLNDIIANIQSSLDSDDPLIQPFNLEGLVNHSVDTVLPSDHLNLQADSSLFINESASNNDNDDNFQLMKAFEEDYVYLEHLSAPPTAKVSSLLNSQPAESNNNYDFVQLDIKVSDDYINCPVHNSVIQTVNTTSQTTFYDSLTHDTENFISVTDTGKSQHHVETDSVFTSQYFTSHSNFGNRSRNNRSRNPFESDIIQKPLVRHKPIKADIYEEKNVEIPILISNQNQQQKRPVQIESKLTDLNRLNLDLDDLVSREEKIFELENKTAAKPPVKQRVKTSLNNPFVQPSYLIQNSSKLQDENTKPRIHEENIYDFNNRNSENGFDLIKVSIVNKRPVSLDSDDLINDSDEETYLDQSLGITEDLSKKFEDNQKRLSSLDPSLSHDCELHSSRNASALQSLNNSIVVHEKPLRLTNPFSSDVNKPKNTVTTRPMSKNNPFRENIETKSNEQLINVEKLNSYKYQYEIHPNQDRTGVIKVKDISMIGVSTPNLRHGPHCALHNSSGSGININSDVRIDLNNRNPFKDDIRKSRSQAKPHNNQSIVISTIEDDINKPHLVKRRFYSEEELIFKEEDEGINEKPSKNTSHPKTEVKISRDKSKSKVRGEDQKEQKGLISGFFNRIIDAIRSPFSKAGPSEPKKSEKSISEAQQSLLSTDEDQEDPTTVYTITDTTLVRDQLPWSKSKEVQTWKASKTKVIAQKSAEKDLTPKEVAKMRKSKSGQNQTDGKTWKCCLF